jgi:hypothetical protein
VIERWHLIDGGETLDVRVEDPGGFTTPWTATSRKIGLGESIARTFLTLLHWGVYQCSPL